MAKEFADPKMPWVARNIEEDPIPEFYWVINSYVGERRMLAWIRQNGISRSLVDFFQDKHDARLFDHLESFTTKDARSEDRVRIDSGGLALIKIILHHRYDHFPLEVVRKFKGLLENPEINDEFAQILQLATDQHRRVQHDRFKQGELDTLPNIQENLRPLLLVDLYARLSEGADDALRVFRQWYDCWNPALWNEERTVKFIDLLLDSGYSNVRGFPEVEVEDRDKIIGRLRYLLSPKPDEERDRAKNRGLATRSAEEIQINPQTLFHETDFSLLQRIFSSGVYANEISSQSRNAAAGRESDLSASFWRLEDIRGDQGQISLKKAIEAFYPKGAGVVAGTAANLKNRVVLCSLDPKGPEEQDFYLYPPYSDSMHQDDLNAPLAKKFTAGVEMLSRTPTQFTEVKKDVVFVLLGIPAVRFNFVIIPPELKDKYTDLTKALPFYLPAYSAESGERLF